MTDKFTCPRRIADGMHTADIPFKMAGPGQDSWTTRAGLVGQPTGCSYCGSLPGDQFMDAVRAGREIGPTDKSYKLYLKVPHPAPGSLRLVSSGTGPASGRPWSDLTRAEKDLIKSEHSLFPKNRKEGFYTFATWGELTEAKFYTHHLTEEQGWEFYRLWKQQRIAWGYPGHAYTRLYLPGPSQADAEDPRLRVEEA